MIHKEGEIFMIRIRQLKLHVSHSQEDLEAKIRKTLRIKPDMLISYSIIKQSLDARKKPDVYYVYVIDVRLKNESVVKKIHSANISVVKEEKSYTVQTSGNRQLKYRPIIIGTGPAGLFCGLLLSRMGYRPILLERGASVEERIRQVNRYWSGGRLDPDSNVQFGEGGAGTFSDGKLNTLVHDPLNRNRFVLQTFVEHGAPGEILYHNKPHIGTDVLSDVVRNMRSSIQEHGGEIRFHSRMESISYRSTEDLRQEISTITVRDLTSGQVSELDTEVLILAIGHSARDTFEMLDKMKIPMTAKSFAVGVRVEHAQEMIDRAQYGAELCGSLPAASYKLTANLENGRGVYTFCMCPGGYVVNASSENGRLAVNGMSYHARNGHNANSAVIVTVTPEDFGGDGPLAGMSFQRKLEEAAYKAGNGKIPVQLFCDFCSNVPSKGPESLSPQMKGAYTWTNVRSVFPEVIAQSLENGIKEFDRKIQGFAEKDTVISGVESRTSSPVRILRDETFQSKIQGIYPCGEGAGYAGGITSAAMDGMKIAEKIAEKYAPFDNGLE